MTVQELIEMLSECNPDMEIVVVDRQNYAMEIAKVDGYEFKDCFTSDPDTFPCIGIKIVNLLGTIEELD